MVSLPITAQLIQCESSSDNSPGLDEKMHQLGEEPRTRATRKRQRGLNYVVEKEIGLC